MMLYPSIDDVVVYKGVAYVLTSQPVPIEDVRLSCGEWGAELFAATARKSDDVDDVNGGYTVTWNVLEQYKSMPANDRAVLWEKMCDWSHIESID